MHSNKPSILVQRDIPATLIPDGTKVTLQKGTLVSVTQALGTAYTVHVNGNLVRINGKDGDGLGLTLLLAPNVNAMPGTLNEKVWALLETCFDPEIPVNIVSLGLVYDCQIIEPIPNHAEIIVIMTLTAPGCGMGPVLINEIEEKLREIKGVALARVELVFDPPWNRDLMSDEAKLQLGLL